MLYILLRANTAEDERYVYIYIYVYIYVYLFPQRHFLPVVQKMKGI